MTSNEKIDLEDKGYLDSVHKTGHSSICVVLKVRIPTKKIIAYILPVAGEVEHSDIEYTMEHGMKLTKSEALGFFPEHVSNIVKHYLID